MASSIQVLAPSYGYFSISLRYRDGCGEYRNPGFTYSTWGPTLFAASSINGQPCQTGTLPRLVVYPNPAAGSITVENIHGAVQLYNAMGYVVRHQQVLGTAATTIDTQRLPNGLYYLTGTGPDGQPTRQAVQVQH